MTPSLKATPSSPLLRRTPCPSPPQLSPLLPLPSASPSPHPLLSIAGPNPAPPSPNPAPPTLLLSPGSNMTIGFFAAPSSPHPLLSIAGPNPAPPTLPLSPGSNTTIGFFKNPVPTRPLDFSRIHKITRNRSRIRQTIKFSSLWTTAERRTHRIRHRNKIVESDVYLINKFTGNEDGGGGGAPEGNGRREGGWGRCSGRRGKKTPTAHGPPSNGCRRDAALLAANFGGPYLAKAGTGI